MSKQIKAKVGEYQKDGQTKGEWVNIGVVLSNGDGEFALIDPTVNLAGVMMKQRLYNAKVGKDNKGDSVMCSLFSDDDRQQQKPQQRQQAPADNGGDFDQDVPF
jgi:hypothetical protein